MTIWVARKNGMGATPACGTSEVTNVDVPTTNVWRPW